MSTLPRAPVPEAQIEVMSYEGLTLRRGERVVVNSRAGTVKPHESGHPLQLELDAGHAGTVLGGLSTTVALVQWHAQSWKEYDDRPTGTRCKLDSFVSSIHLCYLERL